MYLVRLAKIFIIFYAVLLVENERPYFPATSNGVSGLFFLQIALPLTQF